MAEQRAKAAAAKYSQLLNENNNKMEINLPDNRTLEELKTREHDFGSHEQEDDDGEDDEVDDDFEESDVDAEVQRDQPEDSAAKVKRKNRDSKKSLSLKAFKELKSFL